MIGRLFLALPFVAAAGTLAETRQLGSHEHGVGALDIAIDGTQVALGLRAPGADIVGFEHAAESAEDRAAVDNAVAALARPLDLFLFSADAGCSVVQAQAALVIADDDAGHSEGHAHDDDHAQSDDHAHGHDHAHDDEHGHKEHAGATHSEFHADYTLNCSEPGAISEITFAYFETFPNARELDVQIVSADGAKAFEVTRDDPQADLRGMF